MIEFDLVKRISTVVGRRPTNGATPITSPAEEGYHCPVCKYEIWSSDGEHCDDRLEWSEFNFFIWCSVCNKEYPSVICTMSLDEATRIFLDCLEEHRENPGEQRIAGV